ncbi:MAG: MarR family transcriptional regulator [Solirubrobacteraceae bacterium]
MNTLSTPDPAAEGPPAELDPQAEVGRAFKAAMGSVRRLRGRETQQLGRLSHAQYGLLFGLAEQPELPASQLAAIADLAPGTATQMLDHLESHGLVKRVRSERDKRVVLVSLTERGGELVRERRARLEGRWQEALSGFSDAELRTAATVLDRLSELFDGFEERD